MPTSSPFSTTRSGSRRLIRSHVVKASFLNPLRRYYRSLLPLAPFALESLDLRGYDLVISSESGPAKGVLTSSGTRHVCYCHSPMRYLWDLYPAYLHDWTRSPWRRGPIAALTSPLRLWDFATAAHVDEFVANSRNVQQRIWKAYRREAQVVYPPVEVESFYCRPADDYYLVVSELVAYKRIADAVRCSSAAGRRLKIVGQGPEYRALQRMARSNVEFCGRVSPGELRDLYAQLPGAADARRRRLRHGCGGGDGERESGGGARVAAGCWRALPRANRRGRACFTRRRRRRRSAGPSGALKRLRPTCSRSAASLGDAVFRGAFRERMRDALDRHAGRFAARGGLRSPPIPPPGGYPDEKWTYLGPVFGSDRAAWGQQQRALDCETTPARSALPGPCAIRERTARPQHTAHGATHARDPRPPAPAQDERVPARRAETCGAGAGARAAHRSFRNSSSAPPGACCPCSAGTCS